MRTSFRRFVILCVFLYIIKVVIQLFYFTATFPPGRALPFERRNIFTDQEDKPKFRVEFESDKRSIDSNHRDEKPETSRETKVRLHEHDRSYFVGQNKPDDMLQLKRPDFLKNYKNPCWYEQDGTNKTLRCLPFFRLVGVDKCGTTDLWYRLTRHPDIVQPQAVMGKETHWWPWRRFGFDIWVRNRPIHHYDWYLKSFDGPATKIRRHSVQRNGTTYHPRITGEGSPTEFWDFTGWTLIPQNANRSHSNAILTPDCIHHLTPDLKSIAIFRNPTERAYSDYLFLDRFRRIPNMSAASFHRDVTSSIQMLQDCAKSQSLRFCLYNKELHMKMPVRLIPGMYDFFLEEWLRVFPRNQILVFRNEDYSKDIRSHLRTLFQFLELSSIKDKELSRIASLPRVFEKTDRAKGAGPMLEETRAMLNQFYRPFNQMLAARMNDTAYLWKS